MRRMSGEPVQMEEEEEEEVGMNGCENHAEPPKPRQGHQRQEDQLCLCLCVHPCVRTGQQLGESTGVSA